jgi:hypothetical protein
MTGTDPLPVTLKSTVPGSECPDCTRERGINIPGTKNPSLLPGKQQGLSIEVPTWNYDGAVKEQFTLIAKSNDIEVPFDFTVQGYVYTPLTVSPKILRFQKGEREKEIVMRNNSSKDLHLEQVISETRAISIDPFPVVIPPGEERKFTVHAQEVIDTAVPGSMDRMAITYTPLDGFSGISYKVVLNSPDETKGKAPAPAKKDPVQEMLKRNTITLPNH